MQPFVRTVKFSPYPPVWDKKLRQDILRDFSEKEGVNGKSFDIGGRMDDHAEYALQYRKSCC